MEVIHSPSGPLVIVAAEGEISCRPLTALGSCLFSVRVPPLSLSRLYTPSPIPGFSSSRSSSDEIPRAVEWVSLSVGAGRLLITQSCRNQVADQSGARQVSDLALETIATDATAQAAGAGTGNSAGRSGLEPSLIGGLSSSAGAAGVSAADVSMPSGTVGNLGGGGGGNAGGLNSNSSSNSSRGGADSLPDSYFHIFPLLEAVGCSTCPQASGVLLDTHCSSSSTSSASLLLHGLGLNPGPSGSMRG